MPTTESGMYWDERGSTQSPAVLLLEGYTGQLIGWHAAFCDLLVEAGFRVLRMDNRDIGLSRHEPDGTVYSFADMAMDVIDVLDQAGIDQATIVGQSMGGMIAQHVALNHRHRVAGLVLLYTTPTIDIIARDALQLDLDIPHTREDAIEAFIAGNRPTASPAYPYDEARQRDLAGRMYDRDPDQSGIVRQRAAIMAMPDLRSRLSQLTMPVALIHGRSDELIDPSGSLLIAQHVRHAELHLYPGMGHEVPVPLWREFVSAIARTAARSSPPRPHRKHRVKELS